MSTLIGIGNTVYHSSGEGGSGLVYFPTMKDFGAKGQYLELAISGWPVNEDATFSCWMQYNASAADATSVLFAAGDAVVGASAQALRSQVRKTGNNALVSTAGSNGGDFTESTSSAGQAYDSQYLAHVMCSYEAANKRAHFMIYTSLGQLNRSTGSLVNGANFLACDAFAIGARPAPSANRKFNGIMGDVFYKRGVYTLLTNPANILKFRDTNNNPVDPGLDGSGFGIGVPEIFLGGSAYDDAAWELGTNKGSLGDFTWKTSMNLDSRVFPVAYETRIPVNNDINGGPEGAGANLYHDWNYRPYATLTQTALGTPGSRNGLQYDTTPANTFTDSRNEGWHETVTGAILIMTRENNDADGNLNKVYIHRSAGPSDSYNFALAPVLKPGITGTDGVTGTHGINYVDLHRKNFLNYNDGTNDCILYVEYYAADGNPAKLAAWKSSDDGITWSIFWRISDTTANFHHVHSVFLNPYNNRLMMCMGDGGVDGKESMVIQGPSTGDWTALNDKTAQEVADFVALNSSTWAVLFGQQRYRWIDVIFYHGYVYAFTDAGGDPNTAVTDGGIWRCAPDFSDTPYRVFQSPHHYTGAPLGELKVVGYAALLTNKSAEDHSDMMIFTSRVPGGVSSFDTLEFYGSRDGLNFFLIATILVDTAASNKTAKVDHMFNEDTNADSIIWLIGTYPGLATAETGTKLNTLAMTVDNTVKWSGTTVALNA